MGEIVTNYDKTDDLVFSYETCLVDSKQRAEELEQILDACAQNNAQHLKRIMALERLCRDMYEVISERNTWWDGTQGDKKAYGERMDDLGLLEGEDK